ncbi:MAG: DUF1501 domain-containing protein [Acidobacteria bacterium]|nr:MAG: DUF1501 domain-containing protein [Acidobacteriota bacterium]
MIDRRAFLKAGGIALVTLGAGPSFLHRTALAAAEPGAHRRRKVLVTIFQRGAMDGLMAVSPTDDAALRKLRPRLAMSAARNAGDAALVDLGVGFALHPALAPLEPLFRQRQLAIVHAVGSPDPTRSHFDAQDYMETGTPGRKGTADGWLNRVAGRLGHDATPFRAVSLSRALPRSLYGPAPALAVTDLRQLRVRLPGAQAAAQAAGQGFEALYEETSQKLLHDTAHETFEAVDTLERLDVERYRPAPGADYPSSPLGRSLMQIAFLVKSEVGLEVAFAESGGWDTHVQQGTVNGTFANRARDLARSIAAFWTDLGTYRDDVVLMTMTEFGRTVAENGSGGTDHGHGSCLFVLGGGVDGGKVHGSFPGLRREALFEGRDLPVTTDFRSVFAEVAGRHFGIDDDGVIFPGWSGPRLPLIKRS